MRQLSLLPAFLILVLAGVGSVPAEPQQDIPTPESVLGFQPGADFELATYDESLEYFRRLDAVSDRIELVEVGRTSEGRPWYMALVSSPENLANVERYREISLQLAHPEGLSDEQARRLASEGKAIVHIDGGLHATEVAPTQHTIQLAYDLVTGGDDPEIQAILDNVIVLLWPSVNPDGQNIVAEWYESNLGTPFETAPMVELYQKYVGHDNNRDAYMLSMIESRVIGRTWRHWEPQIVYIPHQSSPFPTRIWLPPFADPIAAQVHPLMSRTVNFIGMAMAQALEERGQVGATHMIPFDAWYPGYIDYLPMLQNAAAFWTETALYRYATPHFYTVRDFPENRRELRPESLYPSPWQGGWWRLRDAVEYTVTASIATLDFAAKYKRDLLYNRYQAGRDTIRKYEQEPPYAYFIPQQQRDPVAPVELLRRLAFNGVRVYELERAVSLSGIEYPAGTWVVPLDQEYGELVRQVLMVQEYPDFRESPDGPPEQPYDAAGWTLPYLMDVRVLEAAEPLSSEMRAAMRLVRGEAADWREDSLDPAPFDSVPGLGFDTDPVAAGIIPLPGRISGSGAAIAVSPEQNNAFRAVNAALRSGATVRFESGLPGDSGEPGSSGRYLLVGLQSGNAEETVEALALRAERTAATGTPLPAPRIGLYRPWTASMDEGWTRWLLEQYGFDLLSLRNADFHGTPLAERFDVIILPDIGSRQILEGYSRGTVPARYAGGIGARGVRALDDFVRQGGTVVCMNASSDFAIEELNLPVTNVAADLGRDELFTSGSILEAIADPAHPIMAGMPTRSKIFVWRSPVFTTEEGFEGAALAKYQEHGSPLLSGYLLGEEYLQGHAAALDVHLGDGHVILLGFKPQWRGQPFGTFRVLFNAALFHGEHAAMGQGSPDFWTAPPATEGEETPGTE